MPDIIVVRRRDAIFRVHQLNRAVRGIIKEGVDDSAGFIKLACLWASKVAAP